MITKLNITIDDPKVEKIFLQARSTIDGNIIVSDHPEIDIMILASKSKLVTLPKEELDDEVYESQQRLFKHLVMKGVIDYSSVQAGNLFMSMEAVIPEATSGDKIQYILYAISEFIKEELPFYRDQEEFEKEMEDQLLEPEVDEYTELDTDKYHADNKGSLPPKYTRWGISNIYRL